MELSAIAEVCLALRARRLARKISRLYDLALGPVGLDSSQFNILTAIGAATPTPLTEVSALLDLDPSTLSRTIKVLEARGYIAVNGGRGRAGLSLALTERGQDVMAEAVGAWRQVQAKMTASLGEAEVGRIIEGFDRLEQATVRNEQARNAVRHYRTAGSSRKMGSRLGSISPDVPRPSGALVSGRNAQATC
jgi:DNA-binding MarR family transcriptional regulator